MPDIDWNRRVWTQRDWTDEGDKWSSWWGGTHPMWLAFIQPRIQSFVPTGTILEIAPGFGRWTQYFKDLADHLVVVDLVEGCIEHSRERFASSTNIEYHVNDGRSLDMIEDQSVDFAVSIDSLVHAEVTVIEGYLFELAKKLRRDGVGLFHHSNLGDHTALMEIAKRMPRKFPSPTRAAWLAC